MLDKFLKKRGIESPDQLTEAEKVTWRQWTEILARKEATLDDVKGLLSSELQRANHELHAFDNTDKKQMFYAALAKFSETLLTAISAPQKQREQLLAFLREKHGIE